MPRRKGRDALLGLLLVPALLVWPFTAVRDSIGLILPIAVIVGIIALIFFLKIQTKKKRLEFLTCKYGDAAIVDNIYNHRYWHGQTAEQLTDSLGNPHGIDRKLLKRIRREVWKYNPRGVNRYGLRITLDNDVVSNWDHKQ